MSNSKTTQANQYETSSSGNNNFKLIPIRKNHYHQICKTEINVGRYISQVLEQATLVPPSTQEELKFFRLFGLTNGQSFSDAQAQIKPQIWLQGKISIGKPLKIGKIKKNQKQQIYAANPKTNKCLICKETFDNYQQHIRTFAHQKNQKTYMITQSKSRIGLDQVIRKLMNSLQRIDPPRQRILEYKKRQRSTSTNDEIYLISKPRKRASKEAAQNLFVSSQQSTNLINSSGLL